MSNFRTAKEALYNISAFVFMMVGFLMATIILAVFNIKYVGPGRPSFVMLVIMLSGWVGLSTVFAWLAWGLNMLLWKPFLTTEEVKEYVFKIQPEDIGIPKVILVPFVAPYYKLTKLIFPKEYKKLAEQHKELFKRY